MTAGEALKICGELSIPLAELELGFSRSGGSGGQNVNKVNTKVTLHFDVTNSPSLTAAQKQQVYERLANRLTNDGFLYLSASEYRSQGTNRIAVFERFSSLMRFALAPPAKKRKATRPSRKAVERRLEVKKKRAQLKRQRGRISE